MAWTCNCHLANKTDQWKFFINGAISPIARLLRFLIPGKQLSNGRWRLQMATESHWRRRNGCRHEFLMRSQQSGVDWRRCCTRMPPARRQPASAPDCHVTRRAGSLSAGWSQNVRRVECASAQSVFPSYLQASRDDRHSVHFSRTYKNKSVDNTEKKITCMNETFRHNQQNFSKTS